MRDQILEQDSGEVEKNVQFGNDSGQNASPAVLVEVLTDAMMRARTTASEIRLVRSIAQKYGGSRVGITHKELLELAGAHNVSLENAIRRAVEHGFLLVDLDVRPREFQIAPAYHAPE